MSQPKSAREFFARILFTRRRLTEHGREAARREYLKALEAELAAVPAVILGY